MTDTFKDQVAIITGAASGLGLAISRALRHEGVRLALFDLNEEALESAAAGLGDGVSRYTVDVADETQVNEAVARVAKEFGRIDILINSPGITGKTSIRSHEVDTKDLRHVFDVNFMGLFFTSRAVLPVMLKRDYGRILHIASIAGKEGNAGMLAYSASKAAVIGMTKVQGKEYAQTGITINALAPAVIRTAMVDALPEVQVEYMTSKIPMKRCGTLEEVAYMAVFIVSPGASFTTGFTFDLTGGRATY